MHDQPARTDSLTFCHLPVLPDGLPRRNKGSVLLFPAHHIHFPTTHQPTTKPTSHILGFGHTRSLGTYFCIS